jgi:hypothetical protein
MVKSFFALALTIALVAAAAAQGASTSASPSAPTIGVSDHDVIPRQLLSIDVLDHDASLNPYELAWVDSGSAVVAVVTSTLVLDPDGSKRNIPFAVPSANEGLYLVESRKNSAPIARSDVIHIIAPEHEYLPVVLTNETVELTCPVTSTNIYVGGTAYQVELDDPVRPAYNHADKNISLRSYTLNGDPNLKRELVGYGSGDPKAPQLATLFNPHRVPGLTAFYRVHDWHWAPSPQPGTRGEAIDSPPVTGLGLRTAPGEVLQVPDSGYAIGGGYEVVLLFADEDTVTLKYGRDDTAATGYTLHIDNICTDAKLLALYGLLDDPAGPRYLYMPPDHAYDLPTLKSGQPIGTARGSKMFVAIVDTGTFQDPRSCNEWWLVRPGYRGTCPPGP